MNHSFVTAVVPFPAERAAEIARLLDGMGNPAKQGFAERLDATGCIHFMGIHVLPGEGKEPARLILDASVDGGADEALSQLEVALGDDLRQLFAAAGIETRGKTVARLLGSRLVKVNNGWFRNPGLDFDGSPAMSVKRIKDEAALAAQIADTLDARTTGATPLEILTRVRQQLWSDEGKKWAFFAEPAPFLQGVATDHFDTSMVLPAIRAFVQPLLLWAGAVGLLAWLHLGLDAGVGAALITFAGALWLRGAPPPDQQVMSVVWRALELFFWPLIAAAAVVGGLAWWLAGLGWAVLAVAAVGGAGWLLWKAAYNALRAKEETDVPDDQAPSAASIQAMMERESYTAQNLLAACSTVKPGWFRRLTLRFGLAAAGVAAEFYSRPGFLTDIGVIHFARWFCLPGTNKLMFFSNHDGAWESYLEDFIERGYRGVTGIWSNTVGFPKSEGLLDGGARDGDRLRRWTRRQMFPVRFWYTAYPTLSLARIRTNAEIRRGIATIRSEEEAAGWLALFGSAPQPVNLAPLVAPAAADPGIEVAELPTPLFGALPRLRFASVLLLRLGPDKAKNWLQQIEPQVTFGGARGAESALVLGLASSALAKLGLGPEEIATFPVPFQQGNHAPWRARAIGDVGRNAPEQWAWGGPANGVDAALVVYAGDQAQLDQLVAARRQELAQLGHAVVHQLALRPVPQGAARRAEPFGYVDGVSQPIVRGLGDVPAGQQHQVVGPGEFILGYPDTQDFVPPSPTVPARKDPSNILPSAPLTAGRPPDAAGTVQLGERHDLGRNGSFLVIRQLEQDVEGFNGFLDSKATELKDDPRVPALDPAVTVRDWLGAKVIGRWKDGTSLIASPDKPGGVDPDNDFVYGKDDAGGLRCPLGAHIRRANPRDSLDPGNSTQLAITNRHRILRFGRPYEPQNGRKDPGLVFMCLNVDIERQFEFLQQTWLLAPSFHALEQERDSLLSDGKANRFTIPTPAGPLRVKGMADFVTVLGGGYFFLPARKALKYLAQ